MTTYNNYYEFGTDKSDPARYATNFMTSPWSVSVEGEVAKPQKFSVEDLMGWRRSKSASTAIAASKPGRSSCPGSDTR